MSKSSFVAAGDLFITRKLPEKGYEGMQELVDFVEKQDIRFVNLEVTVHDREGYPFGFSGGTWAMAHPSLLKDVKKYGFNVYNSANNHSMDYSHNGLLATTKYLKQEDMNFAGIGENLADASAPVYVEGENIRAAVIAATSSFHESWAAGNQRLDMKGPSRREPPAFSEQVPCDAGILRYAAEVGRRDRHQRPAELGCEGRLCRGTRGQLQIRRP